MSDKAKYEKLVGKYIELHNRGADGDRTARDDKAQVREELRQMERQSARDGRPLAFGTEASKPGRAHVRLTEVVQGECDSKRDLQKEYLRKIREQAGGDIDHEPEVKITSKQNPKGEVTTLTRWHKKRLGL